MKIKHCKIQKMKRTKIKILKKHLQLNFEKKGIFCSKKMKSIQKKNEK